MIDHVLVEQPGSGAGEPEGYKVQTLSPVLAGEGAHECTEGVCRLDQKQPQQRHGAAATL